MSLFSTASKASTSAWVKLPVICPPGTVRASQDRGGHQPTIDDNREVALLQSLPVGGVAVLGRQLEELNANAHQ
jgi:hypothetical protein